MVWVRCYESIYYSLKWKFKKSNSITNDKYSANSEMNWAFVRINFKQMSSDWKKNVLDMKKKLECNILEQELIIVDLSVKLLQWHLDVNHTELKYKTFWLKLIVSYKVILYFFSSTFDYQISYLNHFCKCICTRKSHQNLHALLYGATIGWFFNYLTDWTDFVYYYVLVCVFCGGVFWFNFCVLVNCIQVLVKKTSKYTFKQEVHGPNRSSNKQFLCKFLYTFLNIKSFKIW